MCCLTYFFGLLQHGFLSTLNGLGGNMDGQQSLGQGVMGSGLAQNAAILEQYRPAYLKMAEQAMMQGQEAPPFEQWAAQQHATQPQQQTRRGMLESLFSRVGG